MMSFMKKYILFILCGWLAGCATQNPLTDFRFQTQTVPPYIVASWYQITQPGQPIRIYIEGDGNAFDIAGQPTDNPTPTSPFLREIVADDPNPNTAYLGRPCQYMQAGACSQKDWTTGRFSPQVIRSMNQAVNALRKKAQTEDVILIGYSGGAQVAGLIAVQNPNVKEVLTIAGVLDVEAWTAYHHDLPLNDSLNLKNYKTAFDKIPQKHFVGERDKTVPPELTKQFVADESTVIIVPKATHHDGYESIYEQLYQQ